MLDHNKSYHISGEEVSKCKLYNSYEQKGLHNIIWIVEVFTHLRIKTLVPLYKYYHKKQNNLKHFYVIYKRHTI